MSALLPFCCPKCNQNIPFSAGLFCPNCDGEGAEMYQQSIESSRNCQQENACYSEYPSLSQQFCLDANMSDYIPMSNNNQLFGSQVELNHVSFPDFHQEYPNELEVNPGIEELESYGNNRLLNIRKDFASSALFSSPSTDPHCFIQKRLNTSFNEIAMSGVLDSRTSKKAGVQSIENILAVPGPSGLNRNTTNWSGQIFQSISDIYLQVVGPAELFKCPFCEKELHAHVITCERKVFYKCCLCIVKCSSKKSLRAHLNVHGSNPFKCEVCGEVFKEKGSHDGQKTCKVCLKIFQCKTLLVEHSVSHIDNFECMVCENVIDAHISEQNNKYQCCKCDCQIRYRDSFRRHLFSHIKEKAYKCEVCGKKLSSINCLQKHIKASCSINTIELPYKCEVCDARFASRESICDRHY